MRQPWIWAVAFGLLAAAPAAHGQNWNGVLNRLSDHVGQTVEGRLNDASDKAVNKAFDKTGEGVDCAAGDPNCGKGPASAPVASGSAKCVATDVDCLKQAKAHGQTVEIVNEEDLDTLRCSSTDTGCLQRAKKLGKKVDITD
jgi:hypothetical protein